LVAEVVAEGVVDLLEAIEIGDQQGHAGVVGPDGQRRLELQVQQPPVAEAGQLVCARLAARVGERSHLPECHRSSGDGGQHAAGGEHDADGGHRMEVVENEHGHGAHREQRGDDQHRPPL